MSRKAFSLIELILGTGLFSLLGVFCFVLFRSGTSSFQIVTMRTSVQTDLRRSLVRLEHDLRGASKNLLSVVSGDQDWTRRVLTSEGTTVYRDGLAITNLRDWTLASSYDPYGNPLWNEYIVYYASKKGELVRQLHRPTGAPHQQALPRFTSSSYLNDQPELNAGALDTKILSQKVEEFRVKLDLQSGLIQMKLLLRGQGGKTPTGRRMTNERVEASITCRPRNL